MNKVWLVTGSASGLGRNIAEAVLESGDRLVATARDPKRLDDLVKKYGDRVRAVPLDVTDESAAQAAVQTAVATFGRLDVVVNNAGYGDIAPFEQLSAERFKAVMEFRGHHTNLRRSEFRGHNTNLRRSGSRASSQSLDFGCLKGHERARAPTSTACRNQVSLEGRCRAVWVAIFETGRALDLVMSDGGRAINGETINPSP
jgi:NAD(P)-dependent dehydrogenase (short-subunit alcohol dehydrogenase family)